MLTSYKAGIAYFAATFGLGFLLGTFRVLILIPRIGSLWAVLIELPVMLIISWIMCRWIIERFSAPNEVTNRVMMGTFAFILLMMAELGLSMFLFGRTFSEHFGIYKNVPELLGFFGQMTFGALPLIQSMWDD
jgi:hypothetical protein